MTENIEPHPDKGGVKLASYLTYNCLSINEDGTKDIYLAALRTFWTCDLCGYHMPLTFQEKTLHRQVLTAQNDNNAFFENERFLQYTVYLLRVHAFFCRNLENELLKKGWGCITYNL